MLYMSVLVFRYRIWKGTMNNTKTSQAFKD